MNAVVERSEPMAPAIAGLPDSMPARLLEIAVSQGADLAKLEKLMDLQERWEANNARKAYTASMAAFKANPPTIVKNKHVEFQTSKGRTAYNHATHDEVTNKIAQGLAAHGLSHAWRMAQRDGLIHVVCRVTHELGHFEETELYGNADESGSKNSIQAVGSTITYLQRYTLLAATGLSTAEMREADTDGESTTKAAAEQPPEGYENWRAGMGALAQEENGSAKLTEAWGKSTPAFRRYVVKYDEVWWLETKAKAAKVAKVQP